MIDTRMRLTLYLRRDCHLCAEMHADLERVREQHGFSLELVDIDTDSDLVQRYGHKVPVLVADDYEICHYFLDHPQLVEYLEGRR
jgi:glutaredoxin